MPDHKHWPPGGALGVGQETWHWTRDTTSLVASSCCYCGSNLQSPANPGETGFVLLLWRRNRLKKCKHWSGATIRAGTPPSRISQHPEALSAPPGLWEGVSEQGRNRSGEALCLQLELMPLCPGASSSHPSFSRNSGQRRGAIPAPQ